MPYSIYIPGERQDTRVISFKDEPLMCKNCLQYGDARKHCKRQEATCGKCAAVGHSIEQCSNDTLKCLHCSESHNAGSRECGGYQREETLIRIQGEEKVTLMRARQILKKQQRIHRKRQATVQHSFQL